MRLVPILVGITVAVILTSIVVPIVDDASKSPEEIDVIIIAGQSNTYATIYTNSATASPMPEPGTVYYFGTENAPTWNKTIDLSACDMHDIINGDANAIGGIYPALGAAYHNKTGHKVYLIDTGLSGQTLYTFLPGVGVNWDHVYNVIDAAIKVIPSGIKTNYIGYVWIQGEGDAATPIPTYEARMISLHNAYATGELPIKLPVCYVAKVRETIEGNTHVNASDAQQYLCNTYNSFVMAADITDTFTVSNGLMGPDDLHYSQEGCNLLGNTLGENIGEYNKPHSMEYRQLFGILPIIMIAGLVVVAYAAIRRQSL